ncbi:MAG: DinB family protein [Bacteroidota bacterium]
MSNAAALFEALQSSGERLFAAIAAFPESDFERAPAPEKWSAAYIVEHLVRSEAGILHIMKGPVEPPADRPPMEKVDLVEATFARTDRNYSAQGPIVPKGNRGGKADLLQAMRDARAGTVEALQTLPPDEIVASFEHFFFGKLSRREWAWFNVHHGNRHLVQMEGLKVKFAGE